MSKSARPRNRGRRFGESSPRARCGGLRRIAGDGLPGLASASSGPPRCRFRCRPRRSVAGCVPADRSLSTRVYYWDKGAPRAAAAAGGGPGEREAAGAAGGAPRASVCAVCSLPAPASTEAGARARPALPRTHAQVTRGERLLPRRRRRCEPSRRGAIKVGSRPPTLGPRRPCVWASFRPGPGPGRSFRDGRCGGLLGLGGLTWGPESRRDARRGRRRRRAGSRQAVRSRKVDFGVGG